MYENIFWLGDKLPLTPSRKQKQCILPAGWTYANLNAKAKDNVTSKTDMCSTDWQSTITLRLGVLYKVLPLAGVVLHSITCMHL